MEKIANRSRVKTFFNEINLSPSQISRRTKIPERTVRRWCSRIDEGWDLKDKKKSGRPKKLSEKNLKWLKKKTIRKRKRSPNYLQKKLELEKKVIVSKETVRRSLHSLHLKPIRPQKVPRLDDGKKQKRVEFCQKYLNHPWEKVLFTDEKFFSLTPPYNIKNDVIWGESGDKNQTQQWRSTGVNVWGGISHYGKTDLIFLQGKQDSLNYINQCLAPQLRKMRSIFGKTTWWMQQDGAKKHTSRETLSWMQKKRLRIIPPKDWPPNSPDLSCIENFWGYMETAV